jgi:hypothetical protein
MKTGPFGYHKLSLRTDVMVIWLTWVVRIYCVGFIWDFGSYGTCTNLLDCGRMRRRDPLKHQKVRKSKGETIM